MTADDDTTSILIVDDLPEKILAYRTVLEELGQNIVVAHSGADALRQVLRTDFAVILLDVNMPDMDGFETARLIRQRKLSAHVPIIFLTAFADEVRTAEGYATGGVDYLPTPVVPEVLQAKVRVFVDLFRMRQQVARQAEEQAKRAVAEAQARRAAFLAEASRTLTSSLDFDDTVRGLLRLVVPDLADLAAVTQAEDAGHDWRTVMAWSDGEEISFRMLTDAQAPRDDLRDAHDRVLSAGAPEHLSGLEIRRPFEPDEPGRRLRSALILPLQARGRTLGALTLARSRDGRGEDPEERILAEDLAGRAAIALDNALLVRRIQEADHRKDEFLAMLAHELRNPLAPIRTGLDLLGLAGADPEIVAPMRRQVVHLARLVDDLLDVARITRGTIDLRLQAVDMKKVMASAIETSRPIVEARGHDLSVTASPGPLTVKGDPVRLTQVLTNLVNNAAKYTPDGGSIAISVEAEGSEVVVRVCDTGAGIARDMLPRVFDLFVQADRSLDRAQGGLGIGLTLVRRLVERHYGTVQVYSDGLGMGSEFVVRLPAFTETGDAAEPASEAHGGAARGGASTGRRILVVDDNVDAAGTLGMLLRVSGHETRLAHDGLAAIELAQSFLPEVVLLDIGLPGLDGYEVARRLRTHSATESVLLVAVSGYGQEEDRRRSREAGFDHHLVKPVDIEALRRVLAGAATQVEVG